MPKLLKIIKNPNPILRKKSILVDLKKINEKDFKILIDDMKHTMLKKDGVGLAAPQIGKNKRIITVNTKDGVIAMINPRIINKSFLKEWDEEGCLSVPGIYGKVKRSKKLKCEFFDMDKKKNIISAQGFFARIIQHEIDHLDGILFIDKAKDTRNIDKE
jgi:peptide deformylase